MISKHRGKDSLRLRFLGSGDGGWEGKGGRCHKVTEKTGEQHNRDAQPAGTAGSLSFSKTLEHCGSLSPKGSEWPYVELSHLQSLVPMWSNSTQQASIEMLQKEEVQVSAATQSFYLC